MNTSYVTDKALIQPVDVAQLLCFAPWAENRSLAQIRKMLVKSDLAVLAFMGEQPVGFARVLTDFVFRAYLEDVIVHPEYRSNGIGGSLVGRLEVLLKEQGVERIELSTGKPGFWENLGFHRKPDTTHMMKRLR